MVDIFSERVKMEYERSKGQIFLRIQIICEGSSEADKIKFIYDTGAYLTVINREIYEWFGLDKLPRREANMGGYIASTAGYVFQIPALVVGNRLLSGVWAFTPRCRSIKQNLLGDNVIEYFRPFQDNENNCFYFPPNLTPEPYVSIDKKFTLACDNVLLPESAGNSGYA